MPDESPSIASCAVTGANGYVGSILSNYLRARNIRVIPLQRTATAASGVRVFDLASPPSPAIFEGVDALVHCAYDFSAAGRAAIAISNIDGSLGLFKAAKDAGVRRIIFISTMSAFDGCKSLYGQAKLAVEKTAADWDLVVVRPGLVYGREARGMFGALRKLSALPLVMPLVGLGGQMLYFAHEEDLGRLIQKLVVEGGEIGRPITAAAEHGSTLRRLIEAMNASHPGKSKIPLPIPGWMIWCGLKCLETAGLRPRVRSDSLVSLLNQNPSPDFSATRRTGIAFRDFDAASLQ
jgi:nucleoside-diphosphate-sugar epimerase